MSHAVKDWSGKTFAAPSPFPLSQAWRFKYGLSGTSFSSSSPTMVGQDSVTPGGCTKGLAVYAGYFDGRYANLGTFKTDFPSAVILSITPTGKQGARCVDCEPGDVTPAQAAQFVKANLPLAPAGGRNDGGKPMVYCSEGDAQAVISAVSALGISRSQWILWSAHWIGAHICSPSGCGYPQADATQYASNSAYDSDLFYSYCFTPPVPPPAPSPWPLVSGNTGTLVKTLQENLVKWGFASSNPARFPIDSDYGPLTSAAVNLASAQFRMTQNGECTLALYNLLAASPVVPASPPPVTPPAVTPPPSWVYAPPVSLKKLGAGRQSVKFSFAPADQVNPGAVRWQVVVCKGTKLGQVIESYPRYIPVIPGQKACIQQYGGLEPSTEYILAVRTQGKNGSNSSKWVSFTFTTAG